MHSKNKSILFGPLKSWQLEPTENSENTYLGLQNVLENGTTSAEKGTASSP